MSNQLQATLTPHLSALVQFAFNADGDNRVLRSKAQIDFRPTLELTTGTGANQADKAYRLTGLTIASGGTQDIDLYDLGSLNAGLGAGLDNLGQAVTYAEIVAMCIRNRSTSSGGVLFGGKGTGAAWQSTLLVSGSASDTAQFGPIRPNGFLMFGTTADPAYAVADSTNHILTLTDTGGGSTVDLMLIARSA